MKFESSLKAKLIYVFRINDTAHKDCLKIGETTCDSEQIYGLTPNSSILKDSAKKRINGYTQTAGISYDLLYTELTIYNKKGRLCSFNDKEVHSVLERSGIKRKIFDTENKANEWFITDLETVKNAINAVKEGRQSLNSSEITHNLTPINFRPEQRDAIEKTKKQFKRGNQMLWNAKMRFGKTLSALQVVKDLDYTRTLILTHRPVVDSGWFEDFGKIFYDTPDFTYGSKNNGDNHFQLEKRACQGKCKYVYFASMQDLRGSELVGGNFDKNNEVFSTEWNFIIVDEAHEGTQTELGKSVLNELIKPKTKILRLSGTPFNLIDDFNEDEIYTWDYVMEQRAKVNWDIIHQGDHNPYASLPTMHIFTYDLGRLLNEYVDEDVAFNFKEFFRVNKEEKFIHEKDIKAFLNLLTKEDDESCYPFANKNYRDIFRHTLWMLPGVKEARALSILLQQHSVFQYFKIVNVAGDGDQDEENKNALIAVKSAIGNNPDKTRTITLSCGRLTTGVSVEAWNGVFMLSGSYNTAASSYMQTIFRVQTPATINGKVKEDAYVFDFAPDRTLKVIAETAKISSKAGQTSNDDRKIMGEFLNFCPIISIEGSKMETYDVPKMLEQLKRVYIERVIQNGFEDRSLYSDELLKLNDIELQEFDDLKKIIGQTKAMPKSNQIDINNQGLTNEQYEELESLEKKAKKKHVELSEEEKRRMEELAAKKKNREAAISILRGISIRMPLLIYGAELNNEKEDITIDNFTSFIDAQSWEEFMPRGVTKQKFNNIKKYYDPEIFCAAGKRIRAIARAADKLSVEDRIERITNIFRTFRNPDKETVLTPWRVVNMHIGDCMGGYNFFEDGYNSQINEPRFIDRGEVTYNIFNVDSHILEINSKSGLYPLYMAYSIYRSRIASLLTSPETLEEYLEIWDKTLKENIFVICKTKMAAAITRRTLLGFRSGKVNTHAFDDLINQIKNKQETLIGKISRSIFWNIKENFTMKFNAIVGNPPYQEIDGGGIGDSAKPIYNIFVDIAKKLSPRYMSMIMPSRWLKGGKGLSSFRESMMDDECISLIYDYADAKKCFPSIHIDGGICYFRWDSSLKGSNQSVEYVYHALDGDIVRTNRKLKDEMSKTVIRDSRQQTIISKSANQGIAFSSIVSTRNPFGFNADLFNKINEYKHLEILEYCKPNYCKIYGVRGIKGGAKRVTAYVPKQKVTKSIESINKYKIFFSKAYMTTSTVPPEMILAENNEICTETFLKVGDFKTKEEMQNCYQYIKSKFCRALLFFNRSSLNISKETFDLVPLQDFTSLSDIDWTKPIADIDKQLYTKYNLTNEEINFIEKMIKPM